MGAGNHDVAALLRSGPALDRMAFSWASAEAPGSPAGGAISRGAELGAPTAVPAMHAQSDTF